MWRVLHPGRSRKNVVCAGCTGSSAAQPNQIGERQDEDDNQLK